MIEEIISIDIGSTYTKGARFRILENRLEIVRRASTPTTVENLETGFGQVYSALTGMPYQSSGSSNEPQKYKVRFSSSAKGGLRMAAVGIVPDLTLQIARLAAWSAGARVVADSSYKLRKEVLERMLEKAPDIILFTGGTDGGNEDTVLWNARILAYSEFKGTILYAGNQAIRSDVCSILEGKRVVTAPNVMPRVGDIQIEETRQKIQEIFLDTIVAGKGLSHVQEFCQTEPVPTPAAVFDLVEALGQYQEGWDRFCVIDLGGATTDFYSCGEPFLGGEGIVLKGLREPRVKRTVEGDLGLRISAVSLFETAKPFLEQIVNGPLDVLFGYVSRVASDPGWLPSTVQEQGFDQILALAASVLAAVRHGGMLEETYTPAGRIYLQSGKDLRPSTILVGSGGYLSQFNLGVELRSLLQKVSLSGVGGYKQEGRGNRIHLLPEKALYYRDSSYLFPLLGNVVKEYPRQAVLTAVENLVPETTS